MSRTILAAVVFCVAFAGCADQHKGPKLNVNSVSISGKLPVQSGTQRLRPRKIVTKDYGLWLHVDYTVSAVDPSYDVYFGANTKAQLESDGSWRLYYGWMYMRWSAPPPHFYWIHTSRIAACADGSELVVWVEGGGVFDVLDLHRVFFVSTETNGHASVLRTLHSEPETLQSPGDYEVIDYLLLQTIKAQGQNPTVDDKLRLFLEEARAAHSG
jgi:hypothetical protein